MKDMLLKINIFARSVGFMRETFSTGFQPFPCSLSWLQIHLIEPIWSPAELIHWLKREKTDLIWPVEFMLRWILFTQAIGENYGETSIGVELTLITQIIMIIKFSKLVLMLKNIWFSHHHLVRWKGWMGSSILSLASKGWESVAIEHRRKFH